MSILTPVIGQEPTDDLGQVISLRAGNISKAQAIYKTFEKSYLEGLSQQHDSLKKIPREGLFNLFKRWEYHITPHLDAKGNFDFGREAAAIEQYLKTNKNKRVSAASNWQPLGPYQRTSTNYANIGRVECIAFHPTDANTFYIGAPSGGVWKTTDNGTTWQFLSDSWDQLYVSGLTIDPNAPNTIYAVIGNNYIYKSTDGGSTWSKMFTSGFNARNKLIIDPTNSNNMFATSWSGIIRSTDGGATWTVRYAARATEDIAFKPNDYNTIYATTSLSLVKSNDGGNTFGVAYNLPNNSIAANVAVTPAAPNHVYLVYVSNISLNIYYRAFGAIYKSVDSGNSFATITDTSTPVSINYGNPCTSGCTVGDNAYHQGRYDLTLAVSPSDTNEIWLGVVPLLSTTNGGASWRVEGNATTSVHVDHHATAFHPITGKTYIGCDGGLYRYTRATNTYEILDGFNITQIYRLGGLSNYPQKVLYGTQDNGTFKLESSNFTNTLGGDGMECFIDYSNPNILYGTYQNGVLNKSTANGAGWQTISPSPFPLYAGWVTPWALHPTNPSIIFAGYDNLYKSINAGASWSAISNFGITQAIQVLRVAPSDANVIYVSFPSGNIRRTTNGGTSWDVITKPTGIWSLSDIAVHPTNSSEIWGTSYGKVHKSIDGGNNWTDVSGTLPTNLSILSILIDKSSLDVYLGTGVGVFVRPAAGTDWQYFSINLPKVEVSEMEVIAGGGNRLRAVTYGRGIWESPVFTPCTVPPATITVNGSSVLSASNTTVSLSANAGAGFTYQWFKNDALIAGATSQNYTASEVGNYKVLVNNGTCGELSAPVNVTTSAVLTLNPITGPLCSSMSYSLAFNASNFPAGTVFTVQLIDIYNYVVSTATGTSSPIVINTNYANGNSYSFKITASNFGLFASSAPIPFGAMSAAITNTNNMVIYSGSICTGKSIVLNATPYNVSNLSNGTYSYQWQLNNADISGANSATYTTSQVGSYSVKISYGSCLKTSNSYNLFASSSNSVSTQVVGSPARCTGNIVKVQSSYMSTTATYSWSKNGVVIPNSNSYTYDATESGNYTVAISDGANCNIYSSSPAIVSIGTGLPAIIRSNSGDTLLCGSGSGYPINLSYQNNFIFPLNTPNPFTYQWKRDGDALTSYTGNYAYAFQPGIYTLTVTDGACRATSNPILIQAGNVLATQITTNGQSPNLCAGQSITISPEFNMTGNLMWQKDGVDVSTNWSYTASSAGTYRLKRTQGNCISYSNEVVVTVNTNSFTPTITTYNSPTFSCNGVWIYVQNAPSGYTYQWRRNGVVVSSNTSSSFYASQTGNYDVVMSNGTCTGTSNLMPITVGVAPGVIVRINNGTPPISSFCSNAYVELSAYYSGNFPTYQWRLNGVDIPGATNALYRATVAGNYSVYSVQGSCTGVSNSVAVSVGVPATGNMPNTAVTGGTTATLTVNFTGYGPWIFTLQDGITRYANINPYSFTVSPTTTTTYSLVSVRNGCKDCPVSYTITNPLTGIDTYQASQYLNIKAPIPPNSNIQAGAYKSVLLEPGFTAENGTTFLANTTGCGSPPPPSVLPPMSSLPPSLTYEGIITK